MTTNSKQTKEGIAETKLNRKAETLKQKLTQVDQNKTKIKNINNNKKQERKVDENKKIANT